MTDRRGQISYRSIGHTEIWACRVALDCIEVTVYDHIAKSEKTITVKTLDAAHVVMSDALTRELRQQQGETL